MVHFRIEKDYLWAWLTHKRSEFWRTKGNTHTISLNASICMRSWEPQKLKFILPCIVCTLLQQFINSRFYLSLTSFISLLGVVDFSKSSYISIPFSCVSNSYFSLTSSSACTVLGRREIYNAVQRVIYLCTCSFPNCILYQFTLDFVFVLFKCVWCRFIYYESLSVIFITKVGWEVLRNFVANSHHCGTRSVMKFIFDIKNW